MQMVQFHHMSSSSPEQETPRKRATRSRVASTRASVASTDRATRATRASRASRKRVAETSERNAGAESQKTPAVAAKAERVDRSPEVRKAPTELSATKRLKRQQQRRRLVVVVVLAVGIGASAAVGLTDTGVIDVQQTIEARNERIRNNQAEERDLVSSKVEVPVQNTNVNKADGGLIGRGVGTPPPTPPPVVATTTATSSLDGTGTSTEAVATTTDTSAEATEATGEGDVETESEVVETMPEAAGDISDSGNPTE